jgi:hypothetical protein
VFLTNRTEALEIVRAEYRQPVIVKLAICLALEDATIYMNHINHLGRDSKL